MVIKIHRLLFVILIMSYCLTSSDTMESQFTMVKYIVFFLCVAYETYCFCKSRSSKRQYMKSEFYGFIPFSLVIFMYSIYKSFMASHFSFRSVQELLFLVFPMIYAYLAINNWSKKTIIKNVRLGLIITFFFYLFSLNMSLKQVYVSIVSSNFGESYSELESFTYCGMALAFFVFFCYYNDSKLFLSVSALFVFMTFKRLLILIAIVMYIISHFEICNKKVSRKIVLFTSCIVIAAGIGYYFITLPSSVSIIESRYGVDFSQFTMTRSDRLRWLLASNWTSYGFGSSTEFMYEMFDGALEMDFTKLILELGFVPAAVFVYQYLYFSKMRLFTFVFMILMLFNHIFASGLTSTFSWSLYFITISCISMYPSYDNKLSLNLGRKKNEEQFSKYSYSSL